MISAFFDLISRFRDSACPKNYADSEEKWAVFRQYFRHDYANWNDLPYEEKHFTVPVQSIQSGPVANIDHLKIAMSGATIGTILLADGIKSVLRISGLEIWIAETIEPCIQKIADDDAHALEMMKEHKHLLAAYIKPSEKTDSKPVIFLPYQSLGQKESSRQGSNYHYGLVAHEVGHFLDSYLDVFSASDEFRKAYQTDIDALSSNSANDLLNFAKRITGVEETKILKLDDEGLALTIRTRNNLIEQCDYYLCQPVSANTLAFGASEAFAEVFAAIQFSGQNPRSEENNALKALLPHTHVVMERLIERLTFEVKTLEAEYRHQAALTQHRNYG